MSESRTPNRENRNLRYKSAFGFTVIEVIIAALIMIILSVGILTVFSNVVERNRGENLRMQALSILQKEVEDYRALKFIPVGSDTRMNAGTYANPFGTRVAADGRAFVTSAIIINLPVGTLDADAKLKEITITATPTITESGWLANLQTNVTIQRVRSN